MSTMTAELHPGDMIKVGDATITLIEKRGQRARVKISAPPDVKIERLKTP